MLTVDQWYAKRQGQSLLVPGAAEEDRGQCVQAADYALNEIYAQPYVWLNAIDWWRQFSSTPQLNNNFTQITDGSIRKGDFVIFNEKVGSVYGHIDIALQDGTTNDFLGADSNWGGNKTVHQVHHIGSQYVIGAIRRKGVDMPTAGNVNTVIYLGLRRKATQAELDKYSKLGWGDLFAYVQEVQESHNFIPRPPQTGIGKAEVVNYINSHLS